MDAKVSIIVPVYNMEKRLRMCLDSILGQSYESLECILINDGSTDTSGDICEEYAVKDNRIKVFHKQNSGVADATNVGLSNMTGDFVLFVDSDDYIDQHMLRTMVRQQQESLADIVECGHYAVSDSGDIIRKTVNIPLFIEGKDHIYEAYLEKKIIGGTLATKLYKAHLFRNVKLPSGMMVADIMTLPLLLKGCNSYLLTSDVFYYSVQVTTSVTRGILTDKKYQDGLQYLSFIHDFIQENCSKYLWYVQWCKVSSSCSNYFRIQESDVVTDKVTKMKQCKQIFKDTFPGYRKTESYKNLSKGNRVLFMMFSISPFFYKFIIKIASAKNRRMK